MSAEIQSVRIFIAYSSKDLEFQRELKNHLEPLVRNKRIAVMDNYAISPGDNWDEKIGQMLEQTDVVLLLLSADALASPHFFREAGIAIERRRRGQTDIIPIKLRPCDLDDEPLLRELDLLEMLPEKDVPVVKWQHRDEAYVSIVQGLKKVLRGREEALTAKQKDGKQHKEAEEATRKKRELQDHSTFHLAKTRGDFEDYLKKGFTLYAKEAKDQIAIFVKQEEVEKKKYEEKALTYNKELGRLVPEVTHQADPFSDLMIPIRGGTFEMGDTFDEGRDSEKPVHQVTVKDFELCKYPVTQAQWKQIMGNDTSNFKGDDLPVAFVSWNDVQVFIKKLNGMLSTGQKPYRLPSEAEWEYAAREGGKKVRFGNGKNIADPKEINFNGKENYKASYSLVGESRQERTPVSHFPANTLELHDMSGNVWEWCTDHLHDNYYDAPKDGSAWTSGGHSSYRVVRGGSWYYGPTLCRAAFRNGYTLDDRFNNLGFRLAR